MTINGQYKWDLDIDNMELEELNALICACKNAKIKANQRALISRIYNVIDDAKEAGLYFVVAENQPSRSKKITRNNLLLTDGAVQIEWEP